MEWILLIGIIWFISLISDSIPDRKKTSRHDDDKSNEHSRLLSKAKEERKARRLEFGLDVDKKETKSEEEELKEIFGGPEINARGKIEEELEEIFSAAGTNAREKIKSRALLEQEKEPPQTENSIVHPLTKGQDEIEKQDTSSSQHLHKSISKRAQERGIKHLVHFTRAENLASIFTHGLRGINYLRANNLLYDYNDEHRFDQRLDGVSLSVMHPNSLMFYKYRKQGKPGAWAILLLDTEVLDRDCLFFKENAASNSERFKSADELRGFERFEQMFEGSNFSHVPKDVQAEVICMEPIPPNLIKMVVFQNSYEERTAKALQLPVPTSVNRNLFERSPSQGAS